MKRTIKCSTDSVSRKKSFDKITELFFDNGYPRKFVKAVIRHTLYKTQQKGDNEQKYIYLKLSLINEEFKRRACSVMRRQGIDNIKIYFMTGKSCFRVFAPLREKLNCLDCETCKLAIEPNRCLTKNVVYEITCSTCGTMYIGETGRTIGSRIKEHLTMGKQMVYKHVKSLRNSIRKNLAIT